MSSESIETHVKIDWNWYNKAILWNWIIAVQLRQNKKQKSVDSSGFDLLYGQILLIWYTWYDNWLNKIDCKVSQATRIIKLDIFGQLTDKTAKNP